MGLGKSSIFNSLKLTQDDKQYMFEDYDLVKILMNNGKFASITTVSWDSLLLIAALRTNQHIPVLL